MAARKIVLVLSALVVALGTMQLAKRMVAAPAVQVGGAASVSAPVVGARVLVAAEDIPAGTLVRVEMLRWRDWPTEDAAGYMLEGKAAAKDFAGAVARQGIRAGEPIVEGRLVKPGERGFLAAVLTPGTRAVSVKVDAVAGIAGFVYPGDRVDLILTHQIEEPGEDTVPDRRASETVLSDVRVVAIDDRTNDQKTSQKPEKPEEPKIATLEVTPRQAEALALVGQMGRLSLSLRSLARSGEEERARGYTWDSDVSALLPKPGRTTQPARTVQVLRGSESNARSFAGRE